MWAIYMADIQRIDAVCDAVRMVPTKNPCNRPTDFVRNVDIRSDVVNYFLGGTPFTQMISGKVGTMIQ